MKGEERKARKWTEWAVQVGGDGVGAEGGR